MGNSFTESIRQSFVVMKNEIKKYFSGKRMLVFTILMGAIIFVLAVAPYLFGGTAKSYYFVAVASLIVLMASTLFASISIVSEYEERTALIVFTRPIRKTSIFTGKLLACLSLTIGFTFLYYMVAILVGAIVDHSVNADMMASFGMACCYAFATTGVAMLVSSLMKKGSTATIITFVVLAVILMAVSLVLSGTSVDTSWVLYDAAESIEYASSDFRDFTNQMLDDLSKMLSDPTQFLIPNWREVVLASALIDPDAFVDLLNTVWGLKYSPMDLGQVGEPDYVHDIIVMLAWGIVSLVGAFVAFLRREF